MKKTKKYEHLCIQAYVKFKRAAFVSGCTAHPKIQFVFCLDIPDRKPRTRCKGKQKNCIFDKEFSPKLKFVLHQRKTLRKRHIKFDRFKQYIIGTCLQMVFKMHSKNYTNTTIIATSPCTLIKIKIFCISGKTISIFKLST